jgi:hypothetical protein
MRELPSKTRLLRFAPSWQPAYSKHDIASLLDPVGLAATNVIDSSKEPATFIFLRSPDVCESLRNSGEVRKVGMIHRR